MITEKDDCCDCQSMQEPESKEQLYIGCKIIKGSPMTAKQFAEFKGNEYDKNSKDAPGYKVEYEDGYISWSPKWTFENAYRKLSTGERELLNS